MKQYYDMIGLCKYCIGDCLRLEDEKFNGTHRCENFVARYENWRERYSRDLRKKG